MKNLEIKERKDNLEVRYSKDKKTLTITVKDPSWKTPFQPMLIADVITAIYDLMDPGKNVKFEIFHKGVSDWGFYAVSKDKK